MDACLHLVVMDVLVCVLVSLFVVALIWFWCLFVCDVGWKFVFVISGLGRLVVDTLGR